MPHLSKAISELRLPLIVAPMFLVSSPEIVIAAAKAGVMASLPTLNARTTELFDEWAEEISRNVGEMPWSINLIVHKSNLRLDADLEVCVRHRVPVVIASVGSPARVIAQVHKYGGKLIADVASVTHARKAAAVGVDGLLLLTSGAGGNTGWLNPFAFIEEVRTFFDGPIILAGGIGTGRSMRAAITAGADMVAVGTSFIAATEGFAAPAYREMLIDSGADDIVLTDKVTGLRANMIRASLEQAGFDETAPAPGQYAGGSQPWREVWSAGHGVGSVRAIEPLAAIVARFERGFLESGVTGFEGRSGRTEAPIAGVVG